VNRPLLIAALSTPLLFAPPATHAADLTLDFQGKGLKGSRILLALYATPDTFMNVERAVAKRLIPAEGNAATVTLQNLTPGRYAVSSFADINGNQTLDTGLLGIPTEPYGFSRDARGRFGPPDFEAAVFDLPPQGAIQTIHLR